MFYSPKLLLTALFYNYILVFVRRFVTVCSGDRQLVDSEEMFAVCDKKMFWPKNT